LNFILKKSIMIIIMGTLRIKKMVIILIVAQGII
jgi:hypothetical protein